MTAPARDKRENLPAMTAADALHFDRTSISSALQVAAQLACGCEPYVDVFTYRRWAALGVHVKRGEKAIKFRSFVEVADPESETGFRLVARVMPVFCRCQVAPNAE